VKHFLQAPASKAGDVVGGSGATAKRDSLFGSIMKEEEELEMIKTLPADSALRYTFPQCTCIVLACALHCQCPVVKHKTLSSPTNQSSDPKLIFRATRQKHLEDMIALKYEMQRIKQQAQVDRMTQELEKIKKEDERSKWVQEQEQQLLEAKFRKQLAKENPITSTSSDPRTNAVFKPQGIKFVRSAVFLRGQV
jgi:hypothetical protein